MRLGATVPLQLIVWRSVRAANLAVTQLVTSADPHPARDRPGAIFVRLGAPHWGNDVYGALFANVSFDFYRLYPGLSTRVKRALRRLHAAAGITD